MAISASKPTNRMLYKKFRFMVRKIVTPAVSGKARGLDRKGKYLLKLAGRPPAAKLVNPAGGSCQLDIRLVIGIY
jgi:hypothetical protein